MPNDWFSFKRFTVHQKNAAMKVGTDATLLGAWADISNNPKHLLDIGTGTGILSLMLAQRTEQAETIIQAIDIEELAYQQAAENFSKSPWAERLTATHSDLVGFTQEETLHGSFDHIISNPPYFVDSLTSPTKERAIARHTLLLNYNDLLDCSSRLLTIGGLLSVIIPSDNLRLFADTADQCGLHLTKITFVQTLPQATPKRVLLELSKSGNTDNIPPYTPTERTLLIEHSPGGNYTDEYRQLTRDFYLKF